MSLRPLLEIAADDERFRSLAQRCPRGALGARACLRRRSSRTCWRRSSRPRRGSAGGRCWSSPPTTSARATWPASCAPTWRRAASATTRRAAPATRRTSRRRRTSSACGSRRWTRSTGAASPAVVVASAVALAEAVPDASLRPAGFALERGEEVDLGEVAGAPRRGRLRAHRPGRGARAVRGAGRDPRRLRSHRGPGGAAGAVRRRDRVDPLVLDLHPALARRGRPRRALAGRRARLGAPGAGRAGPRGRRRAAGPRRAAAAGALPRAARPDPRRGGGDHRRRRGDRDRAPRPLGGRHHGDPRRRRAPPLRRRRRAARRARRAAVHRIARTRLA